MKKKVLLGMSGGVDSSVSALLLKEQGYDVIGVTMKLWEDENEENEDGCCNLSSALDAKRVCDKLEIPHYVLNLKEEFKNCVINDFICQYSNCKTPNPCIECNRYLKFNYMYKKAKELGIDYIATGHYAKTEYSDKYERFVLKKAKSDKKDQSYVLYNIPKEIIQNVIFPLADFEDKSEIREIAKANGLKIADKPDSQDICFIPDGNYINFLEKNSKLKKNPGYIVDTDGNILGKHDGLYRYTIGQRKGLGISNKYPLYVIGFDNNKNRLLVGPEEKLYKKEIIVEDINLLLIDELVNPIDVTVKIRYSSKVAKAQIFKFEDNKIKVVFDEPQRGPTPGQSAVFYINDIVLGGGKII